jgi:hypothetical protein
MSSLFLKLYTNRDDNYRAAYVEIVDGMVVSSSPALAFTIGWRETKLRSRSLENGYHISVAVTMKTRPASWATEPPPIEERIYQQHKR